MQAEIEYAFQELGIEITKLYETTDQEGHTRFVLVNITDYQFDVMLEISEDPMASNRWILYNKLKQKTSKGTLQELIHKTTCAKQTGQ